VGGDGKRERWPGAGSGRDLAGGRATTAESQMQGATPNLGSRQPRCAILQRASLCCYRAAFRCANIPSASHPSLPPTRQPSKGPPLGRTPSPASLMADVSASHHPPPPAASVDVGAAGRTSPPPPPLPTDIVAGPGPRSQAFHDSLLPSQTASFELAEGDVTMQSPIRTDLDGLRGDGPSDLPSAGAAVDRDGNPSTDPISAYFKLDFDSFSYYIQTLKVVIGRRVVVRPSRTL